MCTHAKNYTQQRFESIIYAHTPPLHRRRTYRIYTYTLYPSGSGREASRLKLQQNSNSAAVAAARTTTQQYYTNNFRERVGPSLLLSPWQTGIIQLHTVARAIFHTSARARTRGIKTHSAAQRRLWFLRLVCNSCVLLLLLLLLYTGWFTKRNIRLTPIF